MRNINDFFNCELLGVFAVRDAIIDAPEPAMPPVGRRRCPTGDYREAVTLRFGGYTLRIRSPGDAPPLGMIELHAGAQTVSGPIIGETWKKLGHFIRQQESNDGTGR